MNLIDLIALIFTCWAVYVTVASFRSAAKAKVVVVAPLKPMRAEDIPWGNTRGYTFDNEPAQPFIPLVDRNNLFALYNAKLAAANPDDYESSPFSVN